MKRKNKISAVSSKLNCMTNYHKYNCNSFGNINPQQTFIVQILIHAP